MQGAKTETSIDPIGMNVDGFKTFLLGNVKFKLSLAAAAV